MYGPIGGMAVRDGVDLRLAPRRGRLRRHLRRSTYDGKGTTIVAGLPAQGDYGVTDLAFDPRERPALLRRRQRDQQRRRRARQLADRLGAETPAHRRQTLRSDQHAGSVDLVARPAVFLENPPAGLFQDTERAVTAPFQAFGDYQRSRVEAAHDGKPNSAIYSINPLGGRPDLKVEAYGIRLPSGLAFQPDLDVPLPYATNQGMESRGTRPV